MTSEQQPLRLCIITDNLISEFDKGNLPTQLTVLQRLLYETQTKRSNLVDAIKTVIKEVISIWNEISIKVKRIDHCNEKLRKLYESFAEARKFQDRLTEKVTDFLQRLTQVFDISKNDVIKLLGSMDDSVKKSFLLEPIEIIKCKLLSVESSTLSGDQILVHDDIEMLDRTSPPKSVVPVVGYNVFNQSPSPKVIEPEEKLSQTFNQNATIDEIESNENTNIVSEVMTRSKARLMFNTQSSSSEETYVSSQGSDKVFTVAGRNYENKNDRGTINVMTPEVVAAFDKAKVSDRDAVFITALIANTLKIDIESLILNRNSINVARAEIRKKEHENMKQLIQDIPVTFLIVHWDGKLISDDVACKKVDRLPILVSSDQFTKLINVPALQNQKANTIARAVYASLKDWGLLDLINALCCDTTNVNLGDKGGAAILLEQLMDKDLLYLACRRHVLELLLRAAFEQKFPGTTGPDVPMFRRFREQWPTFNVNDFESGFNGLETSLKNEVPHIVESINDFLKEQQPRNDYRELLELSLVFLGFGEEITFKKPGAIHHARWMSKAIFSIKMFLFRTAFKMSKSDQDKLYAVCKFIVFRYLTHWYTAPLAISAPNNDLKLIKSLIEFKNIDKSISDATLHKFRNHLWYLSPELTILSLFDTDVEITTKQKIVSSLENKPSSDEEDIVKKFDPSDEGIRALGNKTLDYFTNSQSLNFFRRFGLDCRFLKMDCAKWEKNRWYEESREKLKNLVVVNDCAERAIHLTEEYVNTRSHDEEQKQYLLQFVDESRKNLLASSDKKKLLKKLKIK